MLVTVVTAVLFSAALTAAVPAPPLLVITGASLTALTVIDASSVAVLNALLPPFDAVLTFVPCVPVVLSQARKVMLADVPAAALGTNRTRSVLRSRSADALVTVPMVNQLAPAVMEYSQLPLPLASDVMAMPSGSPFASVMRSPPALAMRLETRSPVLFVWSSSIVVNDIVPLPSSTGALFTLS